MKYLAGDDEAKMAVVKALDEFYPESPAAGEPAERVRDDDAVDHLGAGGAEGQGQPGQHLVESESHGSVLKGV